MPITLSAIAIATLLSATTPTEPRSFTVHEWGTFTSFSGPVAQNVPHNLRIADDLPPFVQARFVGDRWFPADTPDFIKNALRCTHRMETPVIYFHSKSPLELSVQVNMPKGLITEVYPPVSASTPAKLESPTIPAEGSSIRWERVKVVPEACCDSLSLPDAGASHYAHARKTKGDTVHVTHDGKEHAERFLFYRGVGNLDLGLTAAPLGADQFKLTTPNAKPITHAFTLERLNGKLRFSEHRAVSNSSVLTLGNDNTTDSQLESAMTSALTSAGLLPDEAAAMVSTWKHHWFGEEGTRVLVLLPQQVIDQHLPLTISPTPDKVTRVFVSRLEVLTPERLSTIRDLLRNAEQTDFDKLRLENELKKLGRFRDAAAQMARDALDDGC
ncbi:MAG TPA: hypothetical protein VD997_03755 [Phycisphaerales bacterium]|nr:hypothetical protein [Phycisphaerales bacterium]